MNDRSKEKDRLINPNKTGYVDRKMAKWQGLLLSEHTEKVQEEKKGHRKENQGKEKQSPERMDHILGDSYRQKKTIAIQMDYVKNGHYEKDIVGIVCGYDPNTIYVQTMDSAIVGCPFDFIRHVEKMHPTKWYNVE